MSDLQNAIEAIQDAALTVSGIRAAPDYAPNNMSHYPFVVAYPDSGVYTGDTGAGTIRGIHNVKVELHVSANDMPQALKQIDKYVEAIPKKIMDDPTLSGTVSTIGGDDVEPIVYQYAAFEYAGVKTIGIEFTIQNIKIRSATS